MFLTNKNPIKKNYTDERLQKEKTSDGDKISSEVITRKRFPFSKEEDELLLNLVQFYGIQNKNIWAIIASHMKGRNVRQCRERYQLFLNQNVKKGEKWTCDEDRIILEKYSTLGPHWKKYEQFLAGRTSYSIKNRFKSLMKPKKIIKNIPSFRKINHYYKLFFKNQPISVVNQNDYPNSRLKIDSLISFSKDEKGIENTDLTDDYFENDNNTLIFSDQYFENETLNYY